MSYPENARSHLHQTPVLRSFAMRRALAALLALSVISGLASSRTTHHASVAVHAASAADVRVRSSIPEATFARLLLSPPVSRSFSRPSLKGVTPMPAPTRVRAAAVGGPSAAAVEPTTPVGASPKSRLERRRPPAARSSPAQAAVTTPVGGSSDAQAYALAQLGSVQFACLSFIVTHEGGWDGVRKWNYGGSGAYGIPQALPGSKMASAGADWATNPVTQVRWMIGYVDERYGSACAAQAYWLRHSSY